MTARPSGSGGDASAEMPDEHRGGETTEDDRAGGDRHP
jgi:hypothetical protein